MHDIQWLQSVPGDDRSLHKVCRDFALYNCLSTRDMQSVDQYVDSENKTSMSNDVPIGQ